MPGHQLGEQFATFEQQEDTLTFGMWIFLVTEVLMFSALFALYSAYRVMYGQDFYDALKHNTLVYGTLNMYVMLASSFTVALAIWAVKQARYRLALGLELTTIFLGLGFIVIKMFEYAAHFRERALPGPYYHMTELPTFGANRFFTMYWVMTGLHTIHVAAAICLMVWITWRTFRRHYTPRHYAGLEMGAMFWCLTDVIWIYLWTVMYLT